MAIGLLAFALLVLLYTASIDDDDDDETKGTAVFTMVDFWFLILHALFSVMMVRIDRDTKDRLLLPHPGS